MRKVIVILVVLIGAMSTLIGLKLRSQRRALAGPSGGSGEIEGVTVDLASRVGARIVRIAVKEGQAVHKGDLLLALDCSDPEAQLAEAEARLASARAQAGATDAQRAAAERQTRRLEKLTDDVAAAAIDQSQSGAAGLARQWDAARAQVRAGDAAVARARLLVAECVVRAPRDAEVADLPREEGELTSPGAILVRLVDLSEPIATFYLPNGEVGAAKPGAKAVVVADAFPGETFDGTVRTVALEAEFTPRNIQTRSDRDRLVYPVEVAVRNRDGKLRAGMPVQVTLPGTGSGR
jgi:HlyD family secretion protein